MWLGLGTLWTSVAFLACIVTIVAYLSVAKRDRTDHVDPATD